MGNGDAYGSVDSWLAGIDLYLQTDWEPRLINTGQFCQGHLHGDRLHNISMEVDQRNEWL